MNIKISEIFLEFFSDLGKYDKFQFFTEKLRNADY